ncbi:MAG: hypothetical protein H6618_04915 [Deltaproteobacteria bacterium]|nr:hypothetical protein [Deltaproteobacteria bacterium]
MFLSIKRLTLISLLFIATAAMSSNSYEVFTDNGYIIINENPDKSLLNLLVLINLTDKPISLLTDCSRIQGRGAGIYGASFRDSNFSINETSYHVDDVKQLVKDQADFIQANTSKFSLDLLPPALEAEDSEANKLLILIVNLSKNHELDLSAFENILSNFENKKLAATVMHERATYKDEMLHEQKEYYEENSIQLEFLRKMFKKIDSESETLIPQHSSEKQTEQAISQLSTTTATVQTKRAACSCSLQ